jgi:two-component system LytT family response regulator
LKPFSKERLADALKKAEAKIESGQGASGSILHNKPEPAGPVMRIVVRKGNSIHIIPVENVKYIESQDDYVMVYYGNEKALKQETMKFYEQNLSPVDFVRIHRSYIVKVKEIKKIEPYGKDNHIAVLNSGERLPVSHAGYRLLKNELNF